jgi:hypothetical protein
MSPCLFVGACNPVMDEQIVVNLSVWGPYSNAAGLATLPGELSGRIVAINNRMNMANFVVINFGRLSEVK